MKRFLALVLIIISLFYLVACNTNGNKEQPSSANIHEQETLVPTPTSALQESDFSDEYVKKALKVFETSLEMATVPLGENLLNKKQVYMDFDGDDKKETLNISISHDFPENTATNKPIKIKLTINNSDVVYEDEWNDDVYLHITDFKVDDKYKDIYVLHTGTDVSYASVIYRYDGKKIDKYTEFLHVRKQLYYDQKGTIYFIGLNWPNSGEKDSLPKGFQAMSFNYETKEMLPFEIAN